MAQSKLGVRMRIHLKEADVYNILIDYFEAFPFNDIALQKVFLILAAALDPRFVRMPREKEAVNAQKPAEAEAVISEEQKDLENQILVHVLIQTSVVERIVKLLTAQAHVSFSKNNKTEMGYLTHVVELAQLLNTLKSTNEVARECLEDNEEWETFSQTVLAKQIDHRKGPLYDDPRCPKADAEEANFISRLVGNFK